ncbi:MAG: hypothetical protein CMH62_02575 [Nanoarchaeota archaeon]|nr:hypothetical protein [Nanoarchaeota archaeon]|tara:strand:- start:799 stop:1665 length:867 start_codon:yes stop_codon:yes gene_type:complete
MKDYISVVIPVYNEEKCVRRTIEEIKKVMETTGKSFEIIAVNDCSRDRSYEILSEISDIKVLRHPINQGYGASLKTGIKASKGDWILIIDADGTYLPGEIPNLLKYTKTFDMVVGARTGRYVKIPLSRRPAKFILKKLAKILTKYDIPDLNSGLRIFKKEIALKYWNLFPKGFSFTTTITIASLYNGHYVKYIPINYNERIGESSIKPVRDFVGFMILIIKIVTYFNPLRFFIPISLVIFIMGFFRSLRDFFLLNQIDDLSIVLILISVQIFLFGLLADLVNKRMISN